MRSRPFGGWLHRDDFEKQPQVLRLLAALVAQDDSSLGGGEKNKDRPRGPQLKSCSLKAKSNHRSFDSSLRSSLRMTFSWGVKRKTKTDYEGTTKIVPLKREEQPQVLRLLAALVAQDDKAFLCGIRA